MQINELENTVAILEKSPIRKYLNNNMNKVTLFDNDKAELKNIDEIICSNKANLYSPLKAVILGEVKAGKSTLINALIEKKVSYTNVVEATASILEIKYSNEEKIIIEQKNKEKEILTSLEILEDLMEKNKENQDFFNNISKIIIYVNSKRLKEITIVDTPGLNTITNENEERTNEYIANADVILWVLNAHHLGQNDVFEKLEEILEYGKPIICILNRIDEINGNVDGIIEYVNNEIGYMFSNIFAVSAKKAWDGYIEKNNDKIDKSKINDLYYYILNNIEKNSKSVQEEFIKQSIEFQIVRDYDLHKNIIKRLSLLKENVDKDLLEAKKFNERTKEIMKNRLIEWIDNKFMEEEKEKLMNSNNDQDYIELAKEYISDEYISSKLNSKFKEINNKILQEWINYTEKFINKKDISNLNVDISLTPSLSVTTEKTINDKEVIEAAKEGGVKAGILGFGISSYAAWLGPAAAHVTIGGALSTFMPPLLIIGAAGGAVWKLTKKDKKIANRINEINNMMSEVKTKLRESIIANIKNNIEAASNHYYKENSQKINSILKQCNISNEEILELIKNSNEYISKIDIVLSQKDKITIIDKVISNSKNLKSDDEIIKDLLLEVKSSMISYDLKDLEIKNKFIKALEISDNELNIVSPWISEWVVEDAFISLLEKPLKKGGKIKIIYGIGNEEDARGKKSLENAMKLKNKFEKYNENFKIIKDNTHCKLLICDDKFYMLGSYNFLSFKGTYDGEDMRSESAIYSEDKVMINKLRNRYFKDK